MSCICSGHFRAAIGDSTVEGNLYTFTNMMYIKRGQFNTWDYVITLKYTPKNAPKRNKIQVYSCIISVIVHQSSSGITVGSC